MIGSFINAIGVSSAVGAGICAGGNEGLNAGAFTQYGSFFTFLGQPLFSQPASSGLPTAAGAYVGEGGGLFVTNANTINQLQGSFTTVELNLGFGPQLSGQLAWSTNSACPLGVCVVGSLSTGVGVGASASIYTTNTQAFATTVPDASPVPDLLISDVPLIDPYGSQPFGGDTLVGSSSDAMIAA
jgi:hypothetical protein